MLPELLPFLNDFKVSGTGLGPAILSVEKLLTFSLLPGIMNFHSYLDMVSAALRMASSI